MRKLGMNELVGISSKNLRSGMKNQLKYYKSLAQLEAGAWLREAKPLSCYAITTNQNASHEMIFDICTLKTY